MRGIGRVGPGSRKGREALETVGEISEVGDGGVTSRFPRCGRISRDNFTDFLTNYFVCDCDCVLRLLYDSARTSSAHRPRRRTTLREYHYLLSMAGDHKCPVCQATFTRPQHVARHMRSHTGDRPYKCQHCGDQFARSDLLSRHVNKCHPNEKPLVSSTPSRRKGTASASRATTSKQACDQCVQSTLPCDGANPCSKCIHRKTRCTYVKFHRQTAPLGPGHPARPAHDSSNPAHPSLGAHLSSGPNPYRLSDPFFLPNNGPTLNPSALSHSNASAPNPLYAGHQFTFPPPFRYQYPHMTIRLTIRPAIAPRQTFSPAQA
ncbi:hypothetical protein BC827DRAFT_823662 [Russula dissimulans]|nr:hypothetical protein BC827DRAFT_823662 [Russula dissimulans]